MFSYYGSKSKIVDYYPPPKHKKIIEPFAGSARYSLKYWQNDVLLVDKYDVVINIWKWLQQCSDNDIIGLPKLKKGDDIRKMNLSEDEMIFLSIACGAGASLPQYTVSSLGEQNAKTLYSNTIKNLHKIKHWEIRQGSYNELGNEEATWFVDPPYQFGGHRYKHSNSNIEFNKLSVWCKGRNGQVIVCENTKATWLPFNPIIKFTGTQNNTTTEAIWSNIPTNYDHVQQSLF